jgi:long-chain acyl-CoA synthetase
MNVAQHLERSARHFPDRTAILFEGRTLTCRELEGAVNRTAHALVALGVRPGDRVALYLPNVPEFAVAYLATVKVGAIAVSLNVMLVSEEVGYILSDAGARVLFTTAAQWPQVEPLLGGPAAPAHLIFCEGEGVGDPVRA